METISLEVKISLGRIGLIFLKSSHCWDFYRNKFGSQSKVGKDIEKIFDENSDITEITVVVGAKGRSAHSRTELMIFDSTNKTSLVGTDEAAYRDFYIFTRK